MGARVTREKQVTAYIQECGVPAHILGFRFVRQAILFTIDDPTACTQITKKLYPAIARKNDTTSQKVERAIRHAISVAFVRGNKDVLRKVFRHTIHPSKSKPTNGEFIALLADRIRMGVSK